MKCSSQQQRSLFDTPHLRIGGMGRAVKYALNKAASNSKLSREEIVIEANKLAGDAGVNLCQGGRLTLNTINKWFDINAGHMPTLFGLVVLSQVLDDDSALAQLMAVRDLEIMQPEDQKYRDLGKATHELKLLRKRVRQIEDIV